MHTLDSSPSTRALFPGKRAPNADGVFRARSLSRVRAAWDRGLLFRSLANAGRAVIFLLHVRDCIRVQVRDLIGAFMRSRGLEHSEASQRHYWRPYVRMSQEHVCSQTESHVTKQSETPYPVFYIRDTRELCLGWRCSRIKTPRSGPRH